MIFRVPEFVILMPIMSLLVLFGEWRMIAWGTAGYLAGMVVRWAFTPREWW